MQKNPYEVRLDVMKMAREMLDRDLQVKMEKYKEGLSALRKAQPSGEVIDDYVSKAPSVYTPADLIKATTQLYEFVNTNSRTTSNSK